jgi:hypothetical protein
MNAAPGTDEAAPRAPNGPNAPRAVEALWQWSGIVPLLLGLVVLLGCLVALAGEGFVQRVETADSLTYRTQPLALAGILALGAGFVPCGLLALGLMRILWSEQRATTSFLRFQVGMFPANMLPFVGPALLLAGAELSRHELTFDGQAIVQSEAFFRRGCRVEWPAVTSAELVERAQSPLLEPWRRRVRRVLVLSASGGQREIALPSDAAECDRIASFVQRHLTGAERR